jgi:hypothetical protein
MALIFMQYVALIVHVAIIADDSEEPSEEQLMEMTKQAFDELKSQKSGKVSLSA